MKLLISAALIAATAQAQHSVPNDGQLARNVQAVLSTAITEHDFAGVVLIGRKGRIVHHEAYGLANIEHEVPHRKDTRFKIYSLTKTFTAVAVLRLVEQGKLRLDAPVGDYLPELPKEWHEVTLHHLLSHTSGISDFTNAWASAWRSSNLQTLPRALAKIDKPELASAPGRTWRYNNFGYELIGCVLEQVTGTSYGALIQTLVFKPAGMTDSTVDQPQPIEHKMYLGPAVIPRLATGYNGQPRLPEVAISEMYKLAAAGSIVSTAADLYRFSDALFSGDLLSPELVKTMRTPVASNYGYGIVSTQTLGRRNLRHDGGTNGFLTSLEHFPEDGVTIIFLTNRGYVPMRTIRGTLAEAVFGPADSKAPPAAQ